jgi:HEAT repeat protein
MTRRPHLPPLAIAALVAAASLSSAVRADDDPPAAAPPADTKPADVPGFWTADELMRLDEGLGVINASRADLGFFKRPIDDPFRLDVVNRALDDPLSMGREAAEWDAVARRSDAHRLFAHARSALPDRWPGGDRAFTDVPCDDVVAFLGDGAKDALKRVLDAGTRGASFPRLVRQDVNESTPSDASILRKALRSQVESPTMPLEAPDLADGDFLTAIRRVDVEVHFEDASAAIHAAHALVAALRTKTPEFVGRREFATDAGPVLVYGTGDDVHPADEDALLVIDLGGNDTWLRGASASVLRKRPLAIAIDLSGDDRYVGENDLSFGGALGGVAVQWDCGGNDTYRGGHVSLGAGILGVGVLVDEGGDDVFRSKDFGQGAGAYGIGVMLKKGGNDQYHVDLFGQGFASTWGCGVLADLGGNDVYDAGGAHLHAPLYRDRYQALSQGFAIGARPDASGGVGVLVDVSGNDRYQTDIYGQGSSYWYSLGLLIDDDGHDTYNGTHYCQGTGIHLSAGMLLDRSGNDSYHCLNGVGVGGSHDFAAGILLDRAGDDHYSGSGASQGCGHTNGVGLLLDGGGDDGYCAVHGLTQGDASTVRSTGGIGLLLDAGGKDVYSEATRDEGVWVRGVVGAGVDEPSPPTPSAGPQGPAITKEAAAAKVEETCQVERDGKREWDLDKLWALSSEWAVNDNSVIVPIARERFCALGDPALDRAFDRLKMISIGSGLEFEAVQAVFRHFDGAGRRDEIAKRLIEKTNDPEEFTRRGAVAILSTLKIEAAYDRLVEMLGSDEPNRRAVLGALGAIRRAPPQVAELLRAKNELEGVNAAVCLGAVADDSSIAALAGALGPDVKYLPRTAATEQLAALGAKAVPALSKLARDPAADVTARRNALRALGKCGDPDALDPIVDAFKSPDRWVRLSAYVAGKAFLEKANPVDRAELSAALDEARALEQDPLLKRVR